MSKRQELIIPIDAVFLSSMKLFQFPGLHLNNTKNYVRNVSTTGLFNKVTFCINQSDSSLFLAVAFWFLVICAILFVVCSNVKMYQERRNVCTRPKGGADLCGQILEEVIIEDICVIVEPDDSPLELMKSFPRPEDKTTLEKKARRVYRSK